MNKKVLIIVGLTLVCHAARGDTLMYNNPECGRNKLDFDSKKISKHDLKSIILLDSPFGITGQDALATLEKIEKSIPKELRENYDLNVEQQKYLAWVNQQGIKYKETKNFDVFMEDSSNKKINLDECKKIIQIRKKEKVPLTTENGEIYPIEQNWLDCARKHEFDLGRQEKLNANWENFFKKYQIKKTFIDDDSCI